MASKTSHDYTTRTITENKASKATINGTNSEQLDILRSLMGFFFFFTMAAAASSTGQRLPRPPTCFASGHAYTNTTSIRCTRRLDRAASLYLRSGHSSKPFTVVNARTSDGASRYRANHLRLATAQQFCSRILLFENLTNQRLNLQMVLQVKFALLLANALFGPENSKLLLLLCLRNHMPIWTATNKQFKIVLSCVKTVE